MALPKKSCQTRKNEDVLVNELQDLFGSILHIDVIRSVAIQCDFDEERSTNSLLEMANNIDVKHFQKKEKKMKHPPPIQSPKRPNTSPTKQLQPSTSTSSLPNKSKKQCEFERIVGEINNGFKVLVILRGLPGSGKSRLATTIVKSTIGGNNNFEHILSTDDFFVQRQSYVFDPTRLQDAHEWNQRRTFKAMSRGLSPIIIDNTNIQLWEMKPYATMAIDYGYIIGILEPDTWWCFNDKELAKRNIHGVPKAKIKEMMDRYDKNITPQKLLYAYNLSYKFQKPPQYRLMPPLQKNGFKKGYDVVKSKSITMLNGIGGEFINLMDFTEDINSIPKTKPVKETATSVFLANPVDEILMCQTAETPNNILQPNQMHQRKLFANFENAWGIDEKALQSWDIVKSVNCDDEEGAAALFPPLSPVEVTKPEMCDSSTIVDPSDYRDATNNCKIVTATNRDISAGLPVRNPPINQKTKIDQSCSTDDLIVEENEEKRLKDLKDLFPAVPRSSLMELFNKCNKDFHWTVDLLLEDENLHVTDASEDPEQEIIKNNDNEIIEDQGGIEIEDTVEERLKRKHEADELKKNLESKFDINEEHYSNHVLKVKQFYYGCAEPQPSTSTAVTYLDSDTDDDSHSIQSDDDPKNMIELNLGETFVNQLETMFGCDDEAFPKGFQPIVQMPKSLAQQIYSFYVESICQQMENQNELLERLVKEDEEFARKLQILEDAPQSQSSEPQTMTAILPKQMIEWNMKADNLTTHVTKQKLLYSLFPNIDPDALLEILHAYDYDYNRTVEDLSASVGEQNSDLRVVAQGPPTFSNKIPEKITESAAYYREEARKHIHNREQLYEKVNIYYQQGKKDVAKYYLELAKEETKSYEKANSQAATAYVEEHAKRLQKFDTLDLHYLYVKEAIPQLDVFIDRNINLLQGGSNKIQDLFIITGRGKNSPGGIPRIKRAVIARLKKRTISYVQLNPGLLKIQVTKNTLMTNDIKK